MQPPTLKQLLQDPLYRKYFLTTPTMPASALVTPGAWCVFAQRVNEKWGMKLFDDYAEAFKFTRELLRREDINDVSIVSRRVSFKPPPYPYEWNTYSYEWCVRCRRPSTFAVGQGLHALPRKTEANPHPVISTESVGRCYYCGIRQVGMPYYRPEVNPVTKKVVFSDAK